MSDGGAPASQGAALSCEAVTVRVDDRVLLDGVSLALSAGELVAVVGPNGAGKSTLVRVLSGELTPDAGEVRCGDRPLAALSKLERARHRAVLSQQSVLRFAFSVAEVVAMGRHPQRRLATPADDARAVGAAMAATEVDHLAERAYPTLSGGEQRRTSQARVLSQQAAVLLLDEPTAALDVRHQELAMGLAARVAAQGGAVMAVLHDLSLAAAWADRVVVLHCGRVVADAPPLQALHPASLSRVYDYPLRIVIDPQGSPQVVPDRAAAESTRAGLFPLRVGNAHASDAGWRSA